MDDMLTMQTPRSDDPFLSPGWGAKADGNAPPTTSSPFAFDLHICDYSGATPISLPTSAAGTPAYADMANPFFSDFDPRRVPSSLQPAFMADQASQDDESDYLGNQATLRKRALQRLSLTSSVISSASSAAPSETEEDANESDWDSLSIRRSDSSTGDQFEALDSGLYTAFSSHSLAGPCSFKGESLDSGTLLSHVHSNGTIRAANRTNDGTVTERRGQHASAVSVFNLADFIAESGQSPDAMSVPSADATSGEEAGKAQHQVSAAAEIVGIDGHSPNVTIVKSEQYAQPLQPYLHANATPTRLGARFGAIDLAATPSQHSHAPASSHMPLSASFNGVVSGMQFPAAANAESHMPHPQQQRSMSFKGKVPPALQVATPERPLLHPSLVRVGRQETPPSRSYSSPNIHDYLSCNPAYITPTHAGVAANGTPASPSPAFAHNLFGAGGDFPESPASSVLSSPPRWANALSSEDLGGEETYCASNASVLSSALSSSVPSRSSSIRSCSDAYSVPASPSGCAGQPIRPSRSTSGAAPASPYASPAYGSPMSGQHLLPPSHPLAHLQDPYSGVITKRSRGRRVPSTPEEMTNIGKSGKVYTCKVPGCGKLFKRSEHLKRHIRSIHTNEKPYVCQICLKQFSRHDNLNQHMRVHGSGASSTTSEGNESSVGESPMGSPLSRSPSTASRRDSSSHSFHETRGGTITRRTLNLTDDGVFDFEQAE